MHGTRRGARVPHARGRWVDEAVVVCSKGPNTLVTSRKPGDLDAFCSKTVDAFQKGVRGTAP